MKVDPKNLTTDGRRRFMGSVVVPRPIGWISTIGKNGIVNLAPYSLFNIVFYGPVPLIFVSPHWIRSGKQVKKKDTLRNMEETGEFVVNVVTEDVAEAMNLTAGFYPSDVSEVELAQLTTAPSDLVTAPRIVESPINLECRVTEILQIGKPEVIGEMVLAEVLRVHVRDDLYQDGVIDVSALRVIGRMGDGKYTRTRELFTMIVPKV